jgi:hypothetical protein
MGQLGRPGAKQLGIIALFRQTGALSLKFQRCSGSRLFFERTAQQTRKRGSTQGPVNCGLNPVGSRGQAAPAGFGAGVLAVTEIWTVGDAPPLDR